MSEHWYCATTGQPRYTTIGKNGKERNTTVRDARDGSLVPSVSTINGLLSKAGLNQYFQRMAIQATLDHAKWEGESNEDYIKRLLELAKEDSRKAAERGTAIHDILDSYFSCVYAPEWPNYVHRIKECLDKTFGNRLWLSEKSFAHPEGYGGKVDLYSKPDPVNNLPGVVIDFKTTEKEPGDLTPYYEHTLQLAAYREGLVPGAFCANIFVNGNTNEISLKMHTEQELRDGYESFLSLLKVFKLKNRLN